MATCNLDALCSTPLLTRFSTFLSSFPPSFLLHPECFLLSIIRFRSEEIESDLPMSEFTDSWSPALVPKCLSVHPECLESILVVAPFAPNMGVVCGGD